MQIGNGYLSSVLGFTSLFQGSFFSGGFQPIARIPLHNNSRNYSYGKQFDISYWVSFKLNNMLSLSYRQNFVKSEKIKGSDSDLNIQEMVLNNSNNSGYRIFNNALGINFSINKGIMRNSRISLEYKIPLYQSFDGLQIGNINDFNLSLQYTPGGHKGH